MAAAIVQQKIFGPEQDIVASPDVLTFNAPLTAGSAVIFLITRVNPTASIAFSMTHNADSAALTQAVNAETSVLDSAVSIFYRLSAPTSSNAFSLAFTTNASGSYTAVGFEVSGLVASAPTTGSNPNETAILNHVASTTPISGTGFAVAGGVLGAFRNITAGANYTKDTASGSLAYIGEHRIGTLSNDQGPYIQDGVGTRGCGAMAFFAEAPTAPGPITDLAATAVSSTQVNLTWTAASGATSHRVERATVP